MEIALLWQSMETCSDQEDQMKSMLLILGLVLVSSMAKAEIHQLNFNEPKDLNVKEVYYNHEMHLKVIRILQKLPIQKRMVASHWDSVREKLKKPNPKLI